MILAALLCWIAPLLDCGGGLETPGLTYMHEIRVTHLVGEQPCDTSDPTMGMCPIYAYGPPSIVSTGTDSCVAPPDLGIGDVFYTTTTITDAAGNDDCGV